MSQGVVAFYRGNNALIYKLTAAQALRFVMYERLLSTAKTTMGDNIFSVLLSSTLTSLVLTSVSYPLDLVHGRMAADMSKKPSLYSNKSTNNQSQNRDRLYRSVRDCMVKT